MNMYKAFKEKAYAMRAIENHEAAQAYEEMANKQSDAIYDGMLPQLGFGVKTVQGVALLIDDCGNEREATMTERVLWDALICANSEFSRSECSQ